MAQPEQVQRKKMESSISQSDIKYFRDLIVTETKGLQNLCAKWNDILKSQPEKTVNGSAQNGHESSEQGHIIEPKDSAANGDTKVEQVPEEIKGSIRSTIGQAELLIAQRFTQFKGLIDDAENKTSEKPINASDLQGFWDMIYFQVEDVHQKFKKLEDLKANHWEEKQDLKSSSQSNGSPCPKSEKLRPITNQIQPKKPAVANKNGTDKKPANASSLALRKQIAAARAKAAAAASKNTPETSTPVVDL